MGKKAAGAPPKDLKATPPPSTDKTAEAKPKTNGKASKKAGKQEEAAPKAFLSGIRPAPRPIFFALFAGACFWLVAFYDACAVKGKKKDCGFSGITPANCRSVACFMRGGKGMEKKTIKVSRAEGSSLGLVMAEDFVVDAISDGGAVHEHNAALAADSEDRVLLGDRVLEIDGSSRPVDLRKKAAATDGKTVEIKVERSRLPGFLQWIHNTKGKPNLAERILTSPGTVAFGKHWLALAKVAVPCWLVSGYPLASLPSYFGLSAAVAWQLTRCCHDENVQGGVPHCYKGRQEPLEVVTKKAYADTTALVHRVVEDPRAYVQWMFPQLPMK